MAYDVILFDIDGTLCDPGPSIIDSAKFALNELGIHETNEANLRRLVGPPLEHSFRDYYGFDEATIAHATALFRKKLQKDGISLYTPYPGIPELLENLQKQNKILAIVTSKIDYIAKQALESTNLLSYFQVIGAQRANDITKKEATLLRVLQELKVSDKSSIVMIGDRMHDIEAANANEIDSIGVLWGYGAKEELEKEGATHIIKNANELSSRLM